MSRLRRLTLSGLDADQAALFAAITVGPRAQGPQHFALTAEDGTLNGPFNALLYSPVLGSALQDLGAAVRYATRLTAREREIAILVVANAWDSAFERAAHEAVGRAAGLDDADLAALRAGALPPSDDPHERAVGEFCLALVAGDVGDALWARLHNVLGSAVAVELTTLVGYYATLALQLRVFRVDERES